MVLKSGYRLLRLLLPSSNAFSEFSVPDLVHRADEGEDAVLGETCASDERRVLVTAVDRSEALELF